MRFKPDQSTLGQPAMCEALEPRQMMSVAAWTPSLFAQSDYLSPFYIETTASSSALARPQSELVGTSNAATVSSLLRLNQVRSDSRFPNLDGRGSSVVVIDTGINRDHRFFGPDADNNGVSDRIVYQYDFGDNDTNAADADGHGSNVAGIVGGNDSTYGGVARGVNIIALKVFTDEGAGTFAAVERALQWVVNNAGIYNVVAVNMSLGDSGNWNTRGSKYGLGDELAAIAAMNVPVFASAGNSFASVQSRQGVAYPASDPNVIPVGAVYDQSFGGFSYVSGAQVTSTGADRIAPFSQRTTAFPMLFAPGAPSVGADATGQGTSVMHGTSQASPHVAGLTALLQQAAVSALGRKLTLAELRARLTDGATTIIDGDDEQDNVTNTGASFRRVDALGSINTLMSMSPNTNPNAGFSFGSASFTGAQNVLLQGNGVGQSVVRTFAVRNAGGTTLVLGAPTVTGGAFMLERGLDQSSLAAGESATFEIRFLAPAFGMFDGRVKMSTNRPGQPFVSFRISMSTAPGDVLGTDNVTAAIAPDPGENAPTWTVFHRAGVPMPTTVRTMVAVA